MALKFLVLFCLLQFYALQSVKGQVHKTVDCLVDHPEPPFQCNVSKISVDDQGKHVALPGEQINVTTNIADVAGIHLAYNTTQLPTGLDVIFPKAEKFIAIGCGIKSIKRENFKGFHELIILDLRRNDIEDLPVDVLADLKILHIFAICGNHIKVLPPNLLATNVDLKIFVAMYNKIEELPENFFANNPKMDIVYVGGNSLKSIKVDFTKLHQITKILLNQNACIDLSFQKGEGQLEDFQKTLKEKC